MKDAKCEELSTKVNHARNVVRKSRRVQMKIVPPVCELAHSHHQLPGWQSTRVIDEAKPSISSANMVQSLTTREQQAHGEDEGVKNAITLNEVCAMVQQFRKGEGKGKGKKGACLTCGASDHCSRDCPERQKGQQLDIWRNMEESARQAKMQAKDGTHANANVKTYKTSLTSKNLKIIVSGSFLGHGF